MNFREFKQIYEKKAVNEFPHGVTPNPLVSVCIQTYNQVDYIASCLDSVLLQQASFSFEILLGDDYSSDGTREICIEYAQRHPQRIKLFLHERENNIRLNGGHTGIFNSLYNLFCAKGKYIAYCDGDDFWSDPTKLEQQVNFLEKNQDFVLSYHKAIFIDEKGNEIKEATKTDLSKRDFSSIELKKAVIQPVISTWCFRNVISDIPIEITKTINADNFWISLLGFHGRGKYLPQIKPSYYRIHKSGIWSLIDKDKQLSSKAITYHNMSRYYKTKDNEELEKHFRERSRNYYKMLVWLYLKNFKIGKAIRNGLLVFRK